MIGLRDTELTVQHFAPDDEYFPDKPNHTDVKVKCMVERGASTNDLTNGVFQSSDLKVKVHVSYPARRNVKVGDKFIWHGNKYTVTGVDDGIMDENVVKFRPYKWTFTGEAKNGRA